MDPKKALLQIVMVLIAILVGIGFLFLRQRVPPVTARFDPLPVALGNSQELTLQLDAARGGVRSVRVELVQADRSLPLYAASFDSSGIDQRRLTFKVQPGLQNAREGDSRLEVYASDGFWRLKPVDKKPVLSVPVMVDLTPPKLEIISYTRYVSQGGAAVAVLGSSDAQKVGVEIKGHFYPASPAGDPAKGLHVCFFAIPYDQPTDENPLAVSVDAAGNRTTRIISTVIATHDFKHGSVTLKREFLASKLPELLPQRGEIAPEDYGEAFKYVSTVLRAKAENEMHQLAGQTAQHALWKGAFLQPPNTRVFSNFDETRDYSYEGVALDTKVHAGFDLASVKRAPVPAAAAGHVLFAADLGIYGNTILIDHGLGLQTAYSHLSEMSVSVGQNVKRGETIGRTGTTGLAVGDHLHYEVLVGGTPVNPLQWWDAKWIDAKVRKVLSEGGLDLGI
ncbi:MAG TPA: M23 family metallopeptidase [Candidatus Krumholzibacteria bacterium]|nr:M23 family metallopeptidase [Candidatus Krumholzibacteria bacterium]